MNTATAYIFPETIPEEDLLFPLVQVFETLVHLQTVENEPHPEQDSPFIRELRCSQRLQTRTPVPLGAQRERFLALAKDIAGRGYEYISQLSMLTLAERHPLQSAESKNSIIATLLRGNDILSRQEEEEKLLWQARLILKLGETFDREQRAVAKALLAIDDRQKALLAELREETDALFTESTRPVVREEDGTLRHRLRAWSHLFFHQPPFDQTGLLVTRYEEAMLILRDMYEQNHGQVPNLIAALDLPAAPGSWSIEPTISHQGLQGCLELPATLEALLTSLHEQSIQNGTVSKQDNQHVEQQWQQQCEEQFPAKKYGRCRFELFVFPGISPRCLFLESFAGEAPQKKSGPPVPFPGTIVGLLRT